MTNSSVKRSTWPRVAKLLYLLRRSGVWACLAAITLVLLAYPLKSPVMFLVGWVVMGVAAFYVGWHSPDAKRAKAIQAHVHGHHDKKVGAAA
ncbi:hypothetical protein [Xanthomonas arboricola]|uniref:hypothetical protein n=1 Tax=Xanthomonas arboricola TaxID=56448 RepID=UPI0009B9859C|nr:hypothetical protein [Xanthomonas arboricola]